MTIHKKYLFPFLFLFLCNAHGQRLDTVFRRPMDIPVSLSGSFGDLRAAHFHSGIDFRTQSVIGHKVYAVERGYVSRISVSPTGYGNVLYIDHPNGYTSVYAHLDAFSGEIARYVKRQQYEQERFAVNLLPDSTLFRVNRGELVALSGNTGGSSGPHLHLELRETATQKVVNPLRYGFGVRDNVAPVIQRLAVYPIGEGSTVNGSSDRLILELEKTGNTYRIAGGRKLSVAGKVAFGIQTHDLTAGSNFRFGPYSIRLWVDAALMFSQTMDKFSFDETRYILSLIDYEYFINHQIRFNRLYIEPNNQLSIYDWHANRGIVTFQDAGTHAASVIVSDFHGNSSRLNFSFDYAPIPRQDMFHIPGMNFFSMKPKMYQTEFVYANQGIRVVIPADALYDEIKFSCTASPRPAGLFSSAYRIHERTTPLHKAMTISIAADNLPERLREKALIVQIGAGGRRSSAGGAYRDGFVSAESRVFGEFAIGVDTIPPRVTPVNIHNGANMSGQKDIRFTIRDDFSGIATYNGWINDQWALFEYDAKNNLLYYTFDPERLKKNSEHALRLRITDGKGNVAEYRANFVW